MSIRVAGFLCVLFLAGIQIEAQTTAPNYVLQPSYTAANQAFNLALKNPKFTCATTFSGQSVLLSGGTLFLTFKAVTTIGVGTCVISDTLRGPVFQMPALSAGSYPVQAVQEPACAPLCAAPSQIEFAGTLTVVSPKDSSWFLQPKETAAAKAFTLQLLSYAYGNCQTTFTHTSLTLNRPNTATGRLTASFVVQNNPARLCPADIRPYGPSYAAPALPVGKYAVYAAQHFACEYSNPACLVVIQPKLVDTLNVLPPAATTPLYPVLSSKLPAFAFPDYLGIVQGYRLDGRKAVPKSR